jgi:UDP-perosamine 4-acetyltransferase
MASPRSNDPSPVLVFGGGGHGKQVIDLLRRLTALEPAGIIDDTLPPGERVAGVEVLGGVDSLERARERGLDLAVNAVGGVNDIEARAAVSARLRAAGFRLPTLVDPSAVVEPSATLDDGCQVFALAYVGSHSRLAQDVLVNATAVVNHDCSLGATTNLSPGALLAGQVTTGELVRVGMGATVNVELTLGRLSRVGNGATVKADVPASTRVGAGQIWPLRT